MDIFTGKKMEDLSPSSHNVDVPHVSRTDYTLLDIGDDGFVSDRTPPRPLHAALSCTRSYIVYLEMHLGLRRRWALGGGVCAGHPPPFAHTWTRCELPAPKPEPPHPTPPLPRCPS